jgi:hypothetical protein
VDESFSYVMWILHCVICASLHVYHLVFVAVIFSNHTPIYLSCGGWEERHGGRHRRGGVQRGRGDPLNQCVCVCFAQSN